MTPDSISCLMTFREHAYQQCSRRADTVSASVVVVCHSAHALEFSVSAALITIADAKLI